jgi:hypothetical protein
LRYHSSQNANIYKTAQITPDKTCFDQEKYNYSYSSGSSSPNSSPGNSSGGGDDSIYRDGYMGMSGSGSCAIYSSFCC